MRAKTDIRVKLTGQDGNIFNLLGIALRALRDGGHTELCKPLGRNEQQVLQALYRIAEFVVVE